MLAKVETQIGEMFGFRHEHCSGPDKWPVDAFLIVWPSTHLHWVSIYRTVQDRLVRRGFWSLVPLSMRHNIISTVVIGTLVAQTVTYGSRKFI
jgi:hypothetical protein